MNAQQLHLADGTLVDAWRCSACERIYIERDAYSAGPCCTCRDCGVSLVSDRVHRTVCAACEAKRDQAREAQTLAKAVEVPEHDGPVLVGDEFFGSAEDAEDRFAADGHNAPEFAYVCDVHHYQLDLDDVLEQMIERAEVDDPISPRELDGVDALRAAVDAFNAANAAPTATQFWTPDYKRKVRLTIASEREDATPDRTSTPPRRQRRG